MTLSRVAGVCCRSHVAGAGAGTALRPQPPRAKAWRRCACRMRRSRPPPESPPADSRLPPRPGTRRRTRARAHAWRRCPPFCRVAVTSKPTADSDIKIEVWLPASGWNGKFQAVGNGGWAGTISVSGDGRSDRARLRDRQHGQRPHDARRVVRRRASREGRRLRASIAARDGGARESDVDAYYGDQIDCVSVERLFHGRKPGADARVDVPVRTSMPSSRVRRRTSDRACTPCAWCCIGSFTVHAGSYIPPEKYPAIHKAVMDACDAKDGVKDGVLENPRCVPLRSEGAAVQGCRRPVVPDRRAGRDGTRAVLGHQASENGSGPVLTTAAARIRAAVGNTRRTAAIFERDGDVQVSRREGPGVGSGSLRRGDRRGEDGRCGGGSQYGG